MADVTITISTPTLTGSDTFLVRTRKLPNGIFSAQSTRTNAPFTLTGLSVGQYQIEIIVVKDGVECPATTDVFTVFEPYTCITFTATLVATSAGLYNIEIGYTLPSPLVNPPCGYLIQITGNTVNKLIPYATLPASPIKIQVPNEAMLVRVIADLCNGKRLNCLQQDINALPLVCDPIVVTNVTVDRLLSYGDFRFRVNFTITQSNPITNYMIILVQQTNVITGPIGKSSYAASNPLNITASPTQFSILIDCSLRVPNRLLTFDYLLIDFCGKSHTGTVGIVI